jgi:asparagine synthase (glutamine-hydrolysing)
MCGITGFIDFPKKQNKITLEKMVETLKHRGPNNSGAVLYEDEYAYVGLGQTRLAIIDVSNDGNQPMEYKHLSIVFNGEIYNFEEIKNELTLLGHKFTSNSDTEVILHAFEEWKTECVHKFIGMFTFVIYDKHNNNIHAFRDRAGVKPFFYYEKNGVFMFASELKAFHQHPNFVKEIDIDALSAYFDYGYVPSPYCIFKNTYKLEPGHYLALDLNNNEFKIHEYWNSDLFYSLPKLTLSYDEAKSELHTLLKSAYNYRMIADVPVGVFLSGGYDSTSVAAILQDSSESKIKTFTIGFEEGNNEAPYAKENAAFLGTDHHEYYCTDMEAKAIITDLPYYYDEPFGDSSAIPTTLVSQFAKKEVTVALSADGGDEVFCGYNSYLDMEGKMKKVKTIPVFLRPAFKKSLAIAGGIVSSKKHQLKHKLTGLSESLSKNDFKIASRIFHKSKQVPKHIKKHFIKQNVNELNTHFITKKKIHHTIIEMLMAVDYKTYLPNDILTKVDRATMSVSLEGREPLLDHRILEFAAQLPLSYKYDGITTKRILKDITHDYIPQKMMDRPKTGFSLPISSWLREDLSYLIEENLSEKALTISGLFDEKYLSKQIELFKEGKFHYVTFIWKLLMFQMWYKKWMD